MKKPLFILVGLLCTLLPWSTELLPKPLADNAAPIALTAGLLLALAGITPFPKEAKKLSRLLIQASVVLLGFSMSLRVIADAGLTGLLAAAATITGAISLGFLLGRLLRTDHKTTALLSTGTAICGGSAIAATAPIIRASDAQMSVSFACVFLLNAVALYVFPPIGHALDLTQHQFGTWAAVAIHDVSSLVAAAKQYGDVALADATVIKLTRALWIAPVALAMRAVLLRIERSKLPLPEGGGRGKGNADLSASHSTPASPLSHSPPPPSLASTFPWFILLFLIASAARTLFPALEYPADHILKPIAKTGMVAALFLIGSGLSMKAMKQVGWRPLLQAVLLWVILSTTALIIIKAVVTT